jgi:5,10-methylenetetrahydromethanopterin reductase
MRIGLATGTSSETLQSAVDAIVRAERDGFSSVWRAHIFGLDALMVLALAGQRTERIELGTAVVPTYPRHPHALAQQAATADVASSGRLALGLGRSHQVVIETMFGIAYDKPVAHMRDYLAVVRGLLRDGGCQVHGKAYQVQANLDVAGRRDVPLLIGALMPKMLALCGELCDGTLTWMAGPRYLADTVRPALAEAASAAGRPTPRVVASMPVCVTDHPGKAREFAAKQFAVYGTLPVYRACLDAEGVAGPEDLALVGGESEVRDGLARLAEAGATDFYAAMFPDGTGADTSRSYDLLAGLGGELTP